MKSKHQFIIKNTYEKYGSWTNFFHSYQCNSKISIDQHLENKAQARTVLTGSCEEVIEKLSEVIDNADLKNLSIAKLKITQKQRLFGLFKENAQVIYKNNFLTPYHALDTLAVIAENYHGGARNCSDLQFENEVLKHRVSTLEENIKRSKKRYEEKHTFLQGKINKNELDINTLRNEIEENVESMKPVF